MATKCFCSLWAAALTNMLVFIKADLKLMQTVMVQWV